MDLSAGMSSFSHARQASVLKIFATLACVLVGIAFFDFIAGVSFSLPGLMTVMQEDHGGVLGSPSVTRSLKSEKSRFTGLSLLIAASGIAAVAAALGSPFSGQQVRPRLRHAPCCPRGALGPAATATIGTGRMLKLPGGLDAYVAGDSASGRALVVASDVLGIHTGRNKAICDQLAADGFLVVMPDFFKGAFPDEGASPAWWQMIMQAPGILTPFNTDWDTVSNAFETSLLPFLASQGCKKGFVGLLGFCWGAWVVIRASGAFPDFFACGASAHPSVHNIVNFRGEKEEELLRKVSTPQLVLATRDEPESWKPGGSAQNILQESSSGHVFKEISSVSHGFLPRGDLSDPTMAEAVNRSMEYIKGFFGKHLPVKPKQ